MIDISTDRDERVDVADADIIIPKNDLREKIGHGGLDEAQLARAQKSLEMTAANFELMAPDLFGGYLDNLQDAMSVRPSSATLENLHELVYPTVQLRAQGGMFDYYLVTACSESLLNFLENVKKMDQDAWEVVDVHLMSMQVIVNQRLRGHGGPQGQAMMQELKAACQRYFKRHNNTRSSAAL